MDGLKIIVPCANESDIRRETINFCEELVSTYESEFKAPALCVQTKSALVTRARNDAVYPNEGKLTFPMFEVAMNYLFVDSDVVPKVDDIVAMIKEEGWDVAGGPYPVRGNPALMAAGYIDDQPPFITCMTAEFVKTSENRVIPVDWIGGGFLLVKGHVFLHTPYPWFHEGLIKWECRGVSHSDILGEDISFCSKVAQNKLKIKLFLDAQAEHLWEVRT